MVCMVVWWHHEGGLSWSDFEGVDLFTTTNGLRYGTRRSSLHTLGHLLHFFCADLVTSSKASFCREALSRYMTTRLLTCMLTFGKSQRLEGYRFWAFATDCRKLRTHKGARWRLVNIESMAMRWWVIGKTAIRCVLFCAYDLNEE